MKPKIFISYSSIDKKFAKRIANDLIHAGAYVWIDEGELKIGDSLLNSISEAIYSMDYLLVILSPSAVQSNWVQRELEIASHYEINNKRIKVLPIMYQNCNMPFFLINKLFGDFRLDEEYGKNIKLLLHSVGLPTKTMLFNNTRNYGLKILKREQLLDIKDINGHIVEFTECTQFYALNNDISIYMDTLDAEYRNLNIDNSVIASIYKEEHIWYIESKFIKKYQKGDIFNRKFTCEFVDLFYDPESYWIRHPSDKSEITITTIRFPQERPPQHFFVTEKFVDYEISINSPKKEEYNGQIQLVWELINPNPNSKYKIEWVW